MNWKKRSKFVAVLMAFLVVFSVAAVFAPFVSAQTYTVTDVSITDGNDNVFYVGEKVNITFWTDYPGTPVITVTNLTFGATYDIQTTGPELIGQKVINNITFYEWKISLIPNEPGILRVEADVGGTVEILSDIYVYKITKVALRSVGANASVSEDSILLGNDTLVVNVTVEGPTPPVGLPRYPNESELYVFGKYNLTFVSEAPSTYPAYNGSKLLYLNGYQYNFSTMIPLKTSGNYTFTITNSLGALLIFPSPYYGSWIAVATPVFTLQPISNYTESPQPFIESASFVVGGNNVALSLQYNLSIVLTPGINWSSLGSNVYHNSTLQNLTKAIADKNLYSVTVVDPNLTSGTLRIVSPILGTVYSKPFIVLHKNAQIEVYNTTIYKGQEIKGQAAIVIPSGYAANYTIEAIYAENSSYSIVLKSGSGLATSSYINWNWSTDATWPNLPAGEYTILLNVTLYNTSNVSQKELVNDTKTVYVNENVTLNYASSKFGVYYPGDAVPFTGTFERTDLVNTTLGIEVLQFNGTDYVATTNYTISPIEVNSTAKTFKFNMTFLAPGSYKVIVTEKDVPNIMACVPINVSKFVVNLSETTATIPLGTSYTIHVVTTANESLVVQAPSGIVATPVLDKPYNASTHTAEWNVTFTATSGAKLGQNVINVTVTNGELKNFTLDITDSMTPVYVPTKVVAGNNVFLQFKTSANLSETDYAVTVLGYGVNSTLTTANGLLVDLGPYNATKQCRVVNMTFAVIAPTNTNYPVETIIVSDGHLNFVRNITVVENPEITLTGPTGAIPIGSNITFEGTTLLAPGTQITWKVALLNSTNTSQVIFSTTGTATVKLGTTANVFSFAYKFTQPGLYNVTVNWSKYSETIQVNVTNKGVLTVTTPKAEYYPNGLLEITGHLDNVTEANAISINITWYGHNPVTATVSIVNGTYKYYFNMTEYQASLLAATQYSNILTIAVTYDNGLANATTTVTILNKPEITNFEVPQAPVKAGELFNISAVTNFGLNGTVVLQIVNAKNASDVKVSKVLYTDEMGNVEYAVNTTNWTAGLYNVTLLAGTANVTGTVYVYVIGPNISIVNVTFNVPNVTTVPFNVTANVTLKNSGDLAGNYTFSVFVNGEVFKNYTVEVPAGQEISKLVIIPITKAGNYTIKIGTKEINITASAPVSKPSMPTMGDYEQIVQNASAVYLVFAKYGSADAFAVSQYVGRTLPVSNVYYRLASSFNLSNTTASDVVISVGGPLVNPITAQFESIAPVHMVINGTNITIVTPDGNLNWSAPSPWWNVSKGYFIIQIFKDNATNATVVTIYGTDASSTIAGAYYFYTYIYSNLSAYSGVTWIVGEWIDSSHAPAQFQLPGAPADVGFDPADTVEVVYEG